MRILTQNIQSGLIKVAGQPIAEIGYGLAIFIGFTQSDNLSIVDKMIDKIITLRVFPDQQGKTNLSATEAEASLLLIPNFTLYGSVVGGRRPSFTAALQSDQAETFFNYFVTKIKQRYSKCASGRFGANMEITLVNDGPFSLILDSQQLFGANQ